MTSGASSPSAGLTSSIWTNRPSGVGQSGLRSMKKLTSAVNRTRRSPVPSARTGADGEVGLEILFLKPRAHPAEVVVGKIVGGPEGTRQETATERAVRDKADAELPNGGEDSGRKDATMSAVQAHLSTIRVSTLAAIRGC